MEGARGLSGAPFIRHQSHHGAPTSWLKHLPEALPPNAIPLWVRISTHELCRNTHIQIIATPNGKTRLSQLPGGSFPEGDSQGVLSPALVTALLALLWACWTMATAGLDRDAGAPGDIQWPSQKPWQLYLPPLGPGSTLGLHTWCLRGRHSTLALRSSSLIDRRGVRGAAAWSGWPQGHERRGSGVQS